MNKPRPVPLSMSLVVKKGSKIFSSIPGVDGEVDDGLHFLIDHAGRAAENAGIAINTPMLTGAAIPVVAGLVWLILHRIRRRIEKRVGATA